MNVRLLITLLNRILFSIVVGVAVTGLPFFIGPRVPWLAGILGTPGALVAWFRFGPHSSGSPAYGFIVNTGFWSILAFLVLHLKKLSVQNNGWWPSAKS